MQEKGPPGGPKETSVSQVWSPWGWTRQAGQKAAGGHLGRRLGPGLSKGSGARQRRRAPRSDRPGLFHQPAMRPRASYRSSLNSRAFSHVNWEELSTHYPSLPPHLCRACRGREGSHTSNKGMAPWLTVASRMRVGVCSPGILGEFEPSLGHLRN